MGILDPWNVVFLIGFLVYTLIRRYFVLQTRANQPQIRCIDTVEKILLVGVITTSLLFPAVYLVTPVFSFANYELPIWVRAAGVPILVFALWLFWRSHADLGSNWSVTLEIQAEHKVVDRGVYKRVRHPMYASIFLFALAQGLILNNWLAGWSAWIMFACLYFRRVPQEETMMLDFFGEDYRAYMRKTGRLFPRLFGGK